MRFRETSAVSMILPFLLSLLLLGLLAGCGGGDQSGGQSGGGQQQQAGKATKKETLSKKIAIGTVRAYKDDKRRLSLRPAADAQGKKPVGFKVRKKAQVTLDGDQAELAEIQEGQQAQIRYVVKNDVNRAIIVQLFSKQPAGEDKKKQQSGDDNQQEKQQSGGDEQRPSNQREKTG